MLSLLIKESFVKPKVTIRIFTKILTITSGQWAYRKCLSSALSFSEVSIFGKYFV